MSFSWTMSWYLAILFLVSFHLGQFPFLFVLHDPDTFKEVPCASPQAVFRSHVLKSVICLPSVWIFRLPCCSQLWMFPLWSGLWQWWVTFPFPHAVSRPTVLQLRRLPTSLLPAKSILGPDPSLVPWVFPLANSPTASSFKIPILLYDCKVSYEYTHHSIVVSSPSFFSPSTCRHGLDHSHCFTLSNTAPGI